MGHKAVSIALLYGVFFDLGMSRSEAAEISVEYSDLGHLLYQTMVVHVSGEIRSGDTERLRDAVERNIQPKPRGMIFTFDSPGGNLLEGVSIGRYIASRAELTTSMIGTPTHPEAVCASACVFAYLGADTREKTPEGLFGLHQFSMDSDSMDGEEALGVGQRASAIVTSYLAERGASAAIFDRMVLTGPEGIDWVSDADLAALGIVGGEVMHQSSEFISNDGKLALQMSFEAQTGSHQLVLGCNNPGVYMVASIIAHDDQGEFSDAALILHETRVNPAHVEFVGFKERQLVFLFVMDPQTAMMAMNSQSIGAYYYSDNERHWFGNMQEIDSEKFSSLVTSCLEE